MIHYRVSYENPLTFYLQIELTLDVAADATAPLELQLPAWRPGRYELQNFAQKIPRHFHGVAGVKRPRQNGPGQAFLRANSMPLQRPSIAQIL